MKKNRKQKVTLSIEGEIYTKYRDYCEENAFMLSKKVELFMKNELEDNKSKKRGN